MGSSSGSSATGAKTTQKVSFAETNKPEKGTFILALRSRPSHNCHDSVPSSKQSATPSALASASSSTTKPETNQAMQDFFAAIEEEQPTMFNPRTGR